MTYIQLSLLSKHLPPKTINLELDHPIDFIGPIALHRVCIFS